MALCLCLSACSSYIDTSKPQDTIKLQQNIDNARITGRIAFFTKKERQSLRFVLLKHAKDQDLHLLSPIGSTLATISIKESLVIFKGSDNYFEGNSVDDLVYKAFGFHIPLDNVYALMTGCINNLSYDAKGYPQRARLNGFDINYKDFSYRSNLLLPKSLDIKNKDYRIKIVLD